jgi:Zn-finger nucleic acid-binding protein
MNCPKCGVLMRERERGDVIMDVCPSGDGIWLDGGELERLTNERREYVRSHPGYRPDDDDDDEWYYRRHEGDGRDRDRDRAYRDQYGQPRKKKGFLSTLMENFGGEGGADD